MVFSSMLSPSILLNLENSTLASKQEKMRPLMVVVIHSAVPHQSSLPGELDSSK